MKMVLHLNGDVLICDEADQPFVLGLLSRAKLYKEHGYSYDSHTYTPSESMPKVSLVRDNQVGGLEEELKLAKKEAEASSSRFYKEYTEKNDLAKQLKTLQDKFDSLSAVVMTANATLEEQ